MSNPKVVFEPVLGRWRVEYRNHPTGEWQTEVYASTLEEACEVAQEMTNHDLDGVCRVVDTQPDEAQPVYTVEAMRGDNGSWNQIMPATSSSEAYAYAKQCAEEARSAGENNLKYRVVQTEATGLRVVEGVITGDQIAKAAAIGANLQWSKPSDLAEMSINAHQLTVPLTLDQYQEQAKATAVYPEDKAREYLVAGLAGEVGEVASLFAKHWRADQEWLDYSEVAAELGDVLWFVAMLADELDCDLSTVAQRNLDKLADRANRGKLKGNGDNR